MFTLATNKQLKSIKWLMLRYGLIGIGLIIFNAVYSLFAHGVDSLAMQWCWLIPIVGGGVRYVLMQWLPVARHRIVFWQLNAAIATLSIAAILKGIFEIAGTNSSYLVGMWLVGVLWLIGSGVASVMSLIKQSS